VLEERHCESYAKRNYAFLHKKCDSARSIQFLHLKKRIT